MTRTLIEPVVLRMIEGNNRIDMELPPWARRSHPVVRRELGIYWKTLPLEIGQWTRILAAQAGLVILAIPFPLLYSFVMPVATVSILLMPVAFFAYGQLLLNIILMSVSSILDERQNNTLTLLLVTPITLDSVLYSKLAASVWRQLDTLGLVMLAHVLLALPLLVLQNATYYGQDGSSGLTALVIILSLVTNLARLFIEPLMVGALGLLLGASTSPRIVAVIGAAGLTGMYFLLLNLPRLVPLSIPARLLLELALPLALPLLIGLAALAATAHILRRD